MTASACFTNFKNESMKKLIDMNNDSFLCALVTVAPSQSNLDNWTQYSDVTNELGNGSGYTTGGVALGSPTTAADTVNHRGTWTVNNASWSAATFTVVGAVIYDNTPATKYVLAYVDFGGSQTVTGGTFTVKWSNGATSGIALTLT